ncbi:MAG: hypothetical protein WED81_02405, partial [Rhodothermales bacterium]
MEFLRMRFVHHTSLASLAILLLAGGFSTAQAQPRWGGSAVDMARYHVDAWSVDEGLLQNNVTAL